MPGSVGATGRDRPVATAASAWDKSSASASTEAEGMAARMAAVASVTRASVRPLTMTRAPSGGEGLGDGESDARGRARDQGELVLELKVHGSLNLIWRDSSFG
jgi:hypothetical protein